MRFDPIATLAAPAPSDRLILLTHYPPRFPELRDVTPDPDGGGLWYTCVRSIVDEFQPIAVVQGHVHQWFGSAQQWPGKDRPTLILTPGPQGAILEWDPAGGRVMHRWIEQM